MADCVDWRVPFSFLMKMWNKYSLVMGLLSIIIYFQRPVFASDWEQTLEPALAHMGAGAFDKALPLLEEQANNGNGLAQFNLALFFKLGWVGEPDHNKACVWFEKAAHNDIPVAQYEYAQCLSNNESKVKVAIKWYKRAYERQVINAGCEAGQLLIKHSTDEAELRQGVTLCIEAAERGSIEAALKVAGWYQNGKYLQQNYTSAMRYYTLAAPDKQPLAAFELGKLLDAGLGVQADSRQAAYWYEVAASQGYAAAYLPVAALYWKLAQEAQTNQPHLLAKAYLWGSTAKRQRLSATPEVVEQLHERISATVPDTWKENLDKKILDHIRRFH
ncbi:tetratricopeptide repeat protein [Alteromonas sp. ASW11-130]|uniref:tetratricopeptide repeat protein n=1 Tax=Alteromonas sp. ASW11-130 TaxID=3015775 RepID=UPI002242A53B|nr:tetratricopeptide repeat protein [Alteromonas sp. ASW11-130]MCW8092720.1 sel1 repeat family protein [Alteromonas sp. ASW11-130]